MKQAMRRILILLVELAAGALALGGLAAVLLLWRLSIAPLEHELLSPMLARFLADEPRGISTQIGHSKLAWARVDQQFVLELANVTATNKAGQVVLAVPLARVQLRALPLLWGRLSFVDVRVADLQVNLERRTDGQLALLGVPPLAALETNDELAISSFLAGWPTRLAAMQDWLEMLGKTNIRNARLMIFDDITNTELAFNAPFINIWREQGRLRAGADLLLPAAAQAEPQKLVFAADLSPFDKTGQVTLNFSNLDLQQLGTMASALPLTAPLSGDFTVRYAANNAMALDFKLQLGAGSIPVLNNINQPLQLKAGSVALTASATAEHGFTTATLPVRLELENGGVLSVTAYLSSIDENEREVKVTAAVENLPLAQLPVLWPQGAAPGAYNWVTKNLRDGVATAATFELLGEMVWFEPFTFEFSQLGGTINLANTTVDYLAPMPVITGASAAAVYDAQTMKIEVRDGKIGALAMQPTQVTISGLSEALQQVEMVVNATGPVPEIMRVIDSPPLRYASRVGLSPSALQGNANFTMRLGFPLLNALQLEELQLALTGTITNFASTKLVDGLALKSDKLDLVLDTNEMKINGVASANGAVGKVQWHEVFSPAANQPNSTGEFALNITPATIAAAGLQHDVVLGEIVPAQITYQRFASQPDALLVTADLTPSSINLPRLAYSKPKGARGSASAKLQLQAGQIKIDDLKIEAPDLTIRGTAMIQDGILAALNLSPFKVASTDVVVDLTRDSKRGWVGGIKGKAAYLGALSADIEGQAATPLPAMDVVIDIARADFGSGRFAAPFKAEIERVADEALGDHNFIWRKLAINLMAYGEVPFNFNLLPTADGQSLVITTPNFGSVLHALDRSDDILGGKLEVSGRAIGLGSPIVATMFLDAYRVKKLPFLARLLSAMSADGLVNALSGEQGLKFNRLKGTLIWQGDELRLKNVKTSGGAIGLTTEGTISLATDEVDLQGTVVPFRSVNSVLGNIPVLGDLLGGDSGIFAVTYTAKGRMADVNVSVNPLAVLAPGFLRDVFFME